MANERERTPYPEYSKAYSREEIRPPPKFESSRTPSSNVNKEETREQTFTKSPAKGSPEVYNAKSDKKKKFEVKQSYRTDGLTIFVSEEHREERRELYGEKKKEFTDDELKKHKIITYTAERGNILVYRKKKSDKKCPIIPPKDPNVDPEDDQSKMWRVSVSFNKDVYDVAELLYNDIRLILNKAEDCVKDTDYVSLDKFK